MCGIAGSWTADNCGDAHVRDALSHMTHRGPDDNGLWRHGSLVLGHNRLAILDLTESGKQPMSSLCGSVVVVFNGEIFNYKELCRDFDLSPRGSSDTEVLVLLYLKLGDDFLIHLNGMFAFALYDLRTDTLLCARDRIGEKPFVYTADESGFYFCSELSAMEKLRGAPLKDDPNTSKLAGLKNFRHVPDPFTTKQGVLRLRPGHAMKIVNGTVIRTWRYWQLRKSNYKPVKNGQVVDLIRDCVKLRLRSDVELGIFLSGGLDSSIIAHHANELGVPVRAYTLAADEEELQRAVIMADLLKLDLTVVEYERIRHQEELRKLIETYGENINLLPLAHAGILCEKMAADGVKVALSGIGADEIFYGYDGAALSLLASLLLGKLSWLPHSVLRSVATKKWAGKAINTLACLSTVPVNKQKLLLYKECSDPCLHPLLDEAIGYWADGFDSDSYIDQSNWLGLIAENAHSVAISADLPGMHHSIEIRSPFLDHRIIELAFEISPFRKIGMRGLARYNKKILRDAYSNVLPAEIVTGLKKGFGYKLT